jgi:hypothetical protein
MLNKVSTSAKGVSYLRHIEFKSNYYSDLFKAQAELSEHGSIVIAERA